MEDIEAVRARLEPRLLATEGVVGVGTGLGADGKPRLKIYTNVPVEEVRPRLPKELAGLAFDLEYVGEIKAQPGS
jgi:hypothetical protein